MLLSRQVDLQTSTNWEPWHTIYDHRDIIYKPVSDFERLGHGYRPYPWVRRSSLRKAHSIAISPSSFLRISLHKLRAFARQRTGTTSLNLPYFTCLVARASTDNNSTMIFTLISVMVGVKGISL